MQNPWINISRKAPYTLPQDASSINEFNKSAHDTYKIRDEILPQPFAGNPKTAKVYLLNLNPGFNQKDEYYQNKLESFKTANIDSLTFKNKIGFYFLDKKFAETPAYKWWYSILNGVIKIWGQEKTARQIMCIELFGYHSIKFKGMKKNVPSQEYSIFLAREAMKSKKIIIVMRKEWLKALPELKNYPFCVPLNQTRRPWISQGNLPIGKFERIFKKSYRME